MRSATGRAIDANLNRVTEGLRVAEDILRYGRNDAALQQELKGIRHAVMAVLNSSAYITSRAPLTDVGFSSKGDLEYSRCDHAELIRVNLKRAQEGLRALEELAKLDDAAASRQFKTLRYQVYELERKIASQSAKTLRKGLYLILTDPPAGYERMAEFAVKAGLPLLQLRYKGTDDHRHLETARRLKSITRGSSTALIIDDRPDIALLAEADGVHLGQDDLAPADARKLLGETVILGLSTHNIAQVTAAGTQPLDYIGFGPVFATSSKANPDPATGITNLSEACGRTLLPVVAIGGINAHNLAFVRDTGCNNAAIISAVAQAHDPFSAMDNLNKSFLEQI